MKRLLIFAVAALLVASSAFAGGRKLTAEPDATFSFAVGGLAADGPNSTNNDDTCDISTAPAATLLLPYFAVEVNQPPATARTTLFTVTNTSFLPQIAHVTLWTDWSFPVIDFNLFLTGYDVQSINIYDILGGGGRPGFIGANATSSTNYNTVIGVQAAGNSTIIGTAATPRPINAVATTYNPNFLLAASSDCASIPGNIPVGLVTDARNVLLTGLGGSNTGCANAPGGAQVQVGGNHSALGNGGMAVGYATIDVAATCSIALPTNSNYYLNEILFDNVLIGEYYDINPNPVASGGAAAGNFAGGNPMVHIRAIPEGGRPGSTPTNTTNLPYTFYDRYTPANRRLDRRQPLPSTFAARWISGGATGFVTQLKIWREGLSTAAAVCADYGTRNQAMAFAVIVRFDEAENSNVISSGLTNISPQPIVVPGTLPETQQVAVTNTDIFAPLSTAQVGAVGGWMFMNLNNVAGASAGTGGQGTARLFNPYTTGGGPGAVRAGFEGAGTSTAAGGIRQSQNWVIVSMFAESRYGVDYDAAWLGNGCSVSPLVTTQIGPTGGVLVCTNNLNCPATVNTGTNTTP